MNNDIRFKHNNIVYTYGELVSMVDSKLIDRVYKDRSYFIHRVGNYKMSHFSDNENYNFTISIIYNTIDIFENIHIFDTDIKLFNRNKNLNILLDE